MMPGMGYDVLVIEPQAEPIWLLVPARGVSPKDAEYLYEEHTCPSNTLRRVDLLIIGGDTDPHGLIGYVRTIDRPGFLDRAGGYSSDEWHAILPEAFVSEHREMVEGDL